MLPTLFCLCKLVVSLNGADDSLLVKLVMIRFDLLLMEKPALLSPVDEDFLYSVSLFLLHLFNLRCKLLIIIIKNLKLKTVLRLG